MLTRRELLIQLGHGVGAAGLATIAAGCGGKGTQLQATDRGDDSATLRARLAELIDELEQRYPIATALVHKRRRAIVGHDASDIGANQRVDGLITFQVFDGASWRAFSTNEHTAAGATSIARALLEKRSPSSSSERPTRNAKPVTLSPRGDASLADVPLLKWQDLVAKLFKRSGDAATSRTIYRGASAVIDSDETIFVGAGANLRQVINRARSGVVFVARSGRGIIAEQAAAAGTGSTKVIEISDVELQQASERSLSLIGGGISPVADIDVVLDASVVGALASVLASELLDARTWVAESSALSQLIGDQIADRNFSLRDDATLPGGYGSFDFDDEGAPSGSRALIQEGILIGPLTDRLSAAALNFARTGNARLHPDGVTRAVHSNLIVAPGKVAFDDLLGDVKRGYLVESATMVAADPRRRQVVLRARRAREIVSGSLSGRLAGPLMLRADLLGILLAIRGVSSESRQLVSDGALPQSVIAPTMLTRAELGP